MNKTKKKWINACNSRILHETMVALGALKEQTSLSELPMNEIEVHLLDKEGDGVILCLEYDESTGELKKTFTTVEEYYADDDDDDEIDPESDFTELEMNEISEEYDEIFQSRDKKSSILLN